MTRLLQVCLLLHISMNPLQFKLLVHITPYLATLCCAMDSSLRGRIPKHAQAIVSWQLQMDGMGFACIETTTSQRRRLALEACLDDAPLAMRRRRIAGKICTDEPICIESLRGAQFSVGGS